MRKKSGRKGTGVLGKTVAALGLAAAACGGEIAYFLRAHHEARQG